MNSANYVISLSLGNRASLRQAILLLKWLALDLYIVNSTRITLKDGINMIL